MSATTRIALKSLALSASALALTYTAPAMAQAIVAATSNFVFPSPYIIEALASTTKKARRFDSSS